jgi:hypothetical protein
MAAAKPQKSAKSAKSAKTAKSAKPARTAKSAKTAKVAKTAKTAKTAKAVALDDFLTLNIETRGQAGLKVIEGGPVVAHFARREEY